MSSQPPAGPSAIALEPEVSVIVPVLNESGTVGELAQRHRAAFPLLADVVTDVRELGGLHSLHYIA